MFRKMMMLTGLMILGLALSACSGANGIMNTFSADETLTESFTVSPEAARVVVEMFNGSIEVVTSEDGSVQAEVVKRGAGISQQAAQEDLSKIEVTMTQEGDTVRIIARRTDPNLNIGSSSASASLQVPAGVALDLRTSNDSITVSGAVGAVTAVSSNGPLTVNGATGSLTLETSNDRITVNGGSGTLNLTTSNGAIDITAEKVVVTGRTSNDTFSFKGSLAAGRSLMHTSNAHITVTLPADAAFSLDAGTSNGKVTCAFAVTDAESDDDYLRGTVGSSPETTLVLETSNDNIEIRQAE